MFSSTKIISHAGEAHSDGLETLVHTTAPWYLAVPGFLILLGMIGYLVWLVSGRKLHKVLIVLALVCLVSGFTLFNISAAVSVIAITLGLLLSLMLTFGSLTD